MLIFTLGDAKGTFEDGILRLLGEPLPGTQETLQRMIDYDIAYHEGYLPGMDASARRVLIDVGATITGEDNQYVPDAIY